MLKFTIRKKLFVTLFLACGLSVILAIALFYLRTTQSFKAYIQQRDTYYLQSLSEVLIEYYQTQQSWHALRQHRQWRNLLNSRLRGSDLKYIQPPPNPEFGFKPPRRPPPLHHTARRIVLLDAQQQLIQGRNRPVAFIQRLPLIYQEQTIGYLGLYPRKNFRENKSDAAFFEQQSQTLLLIALLTLITSAAIAGLLSRQIIKPIQSLRHSTRELADGDYNTRVTTQTQDELGQLSQDFNQLAERLQQHEQARKQWIMDIAHELRTPLAVLRGEIEAIQDGISPSDPQTISSLHQETLHLQKLVEDLYQLSVSDNGALSYRKEILDLAELLQNTVAPFISVFKEQGIKLKTSIDKQETLLMHGDPQRLQQLLQNLLKNSLRYTNNPGTLWIHLGKSRDSLALTFKDSAPGVPDESLPRLFERLYRVESSRNRATGGTGIGLSICYNIVKAHNGHIEALHAETGGLKINISLPAQPN